MAHVITVTNRRGGAGKTTTAAALAAGLSIRGFKTLLVDLDSQGNLTYTAGAATTGKTSYDLFKGTAKAADAIQHTSGGDIIAASPALSGADATITGAGKEYRLKAALEPILSRYDYIIIDTPPALGAITINALAASTGVIIPVQAEIYSIIGVEQLGETIKAVRRVCNPGLQICGLLLTQYNPRAVLSRDAAEIAEQLAEKLGTKLYKTTIRAAIAVKEAQISRRTLYEYAPKSKATADYTAFIDEFLGGSTNGEEKL